MKIETRVETVRRIEVRQDGDWVLVEEESPQKTGLWLTSSAFGGSLSRTEWESIKKLGDAAWEAWDKTFGDKQPETMGVFKSESGYRDDGRPKDACRCNKNFLDAEDYRDHLPCPEVNFGGSFVWYPGDHDFKGSAQRALDALKTEKPEWKLELREYKQFLVNKELIEEATARQNRWVEKCVVCGRPAGMTGLAYGKLACQLCR